MKSAEIVAERIERLSFQTAGWKYTIDGDERCWDFSVLAERGYISSGDWIAVEADTITIDANHMQHKAHWVAGFPRDEWDRRVVALQNQFLLPKDSAWDMVAREVLDAARKNGKPQSSYSQSVLYG